MWYSSRLTAIFRHADGKSHSPTKARGAYKDGKQSYPNESSESPYFGSSVHYGAREFYGNTPPKQGDASPGNVRRNWHS